MARPKFSIQMPLAADMASWTDKVRRAEDAGFYSVSVPDHLGRSLPQLAPLVALSAAAAVTDTIRLAITVLDNDFRHPVMVAKEVATLDLLSSGRVDLGLGAGWLEEDYARTGVATWDPPGVRVDRLAESIQLLRLLLAGGEVTFKGRFYEVNGFESYPMPVQQPVPLLIGAEGRRMLSLAAREAQIVSLLLRTQPGEGQPTFEDRLRWIAEAGGRDRDDLEVGVRVLFGEVGRPGEARRAVAERLAASGLARGRSVEELLTSPIGLVGDPAAIKDHVLEMGERYGITYFTVHEDMGWQLAPVVRDLAS